MKQARFFSRPVHQARKQQGVGLLEVLIALLVLSIGIMGLAALQTTGLRLNTQSYQRTQALMAIQDVVDRIRANPTGQMALAYDNVAFDPIPSAPDCGDGTTVCSAQQIADYDIRQWKLMIQDLLGDNAKGAISVIPDPAGINAPLHRIAVRWQENDLTLDFEQDVQIRSNPS